MGNKNQLTEIKNIRSLVKIIKSDGVGLFEYKGKTISIGYRHGKNQEGLNRKQRLYRKRREQGLCVACAKKVKKKNPQTGIKYRLCEEHRKKIDRRH